MAFTKIVGAGIHTLSNVHTHNINSSGIITATNFVGIFSGTNGDFSGNVTIDGNLIVNGDTTTLNTTLREVEILRVDANNSTVGAAITQSGTGDILNLYDGSTEVFSVADGGAVTTSGDINVGGSILLPDSIQHVNDTNTQIRFPTNDQISFLTGGTERLHLSNSGVGIGTDTPIGGLHLNSNGNNGVSFRMENFEGYSTIHNDGAAFHFDSAQHIFRNAAGSSEFIRIDTNGYVGIKESSPHLYYSPDLVVKAAADSGGITIRSAGTSHNNYLMFADGNSGDSRYDGYIKYNHNTRQFDFATATATRFSINSSGHLKHTGLRSGNSENKLALLTAPSYNTSEEDVIIYQVENESGFNQLSIGGGTGSLNAMTALSFRTASAVNTTGGTERLRIHENGNISAGVDNDSYEFTLQGSSGGAPTLWLRDGTTTGSPRIIFGDTNAATVSAIYHKNSNDSLNFYTNGNVNDARLHITSNGLVGVGTETVRNNRTMQITGESGTTLLLTGFAPSINFNGQSSTDSSTEDRTILGQASGNNHMINGSQNGDTVLRGRGSGKLLVGMGSTVKMQLHANGKFGLGTYPTTGVDIGFNVHIKKGSGEPSGQLLIQSHDTANSTAGIQLLARDNSNNNETCRILATSDSGETINLRLYTDDNSNKGMKIKGSDGGINFVGSSDSMLNYTFQNANGNANSDVRLMVKTYANQGADPYIMFDSGGTNHVVGQSYAGTTNNKLVLGAGNSPSGGVNGIHIDGNGNVSVNTDGAILSGGGTFTVRSGSTAGLMKLYGGSSNHGGQITLFGGSNTGGGNGGDIEFRGGSGSGEQTVAVKILGDSKTLQVENTHSGKDSALNVYKATGDNNDYAILRVGYNSSNCYAISRKRNSSSIQVDANQSDAIVHHSAGGDDTMLLTNRNSVHIAKLAPMVVGSPHVQSNSTWGASRPFKFVMRFSTGNFSGNYHVARMITQRDWGFSAWTAKVYRDYYSPDTHDNSVHRYTGYYDSHTDHIIRYNMRNNNPDAFGNGKELSRNTNLGPNGSFTIHQQANGGYYRDCYATDYYVSLGTYSGVVIEIEVQNPGGWLKDSGTSLSTIYPASFGGQASQSDANSWSYGRGLWFNVRPGVLDSSWWGYPSNFGQQNLPTS